ncbi:DUF1903-domain-containing protein [Violaceomyces palustris]|uniref:DUF1903-domain-containing protein n=1 Tax=Violaceomyces palustris TaxID=1673888 RepID=A0ACD0P4A3_9BASI|nr:DUF1903-domain-containing protein [Violaceomyces palustris]
MPSSAEGSRSQQDQRQKPGESLDSNPCHPIACKIQGCLERTGFNQAKCEHLIDDLYRCCAKFYQERGPQAEADSCPLLSVVQRRLKQMEKEGKNVGRNGGELIQGKMVG